MAYLRDKQKSPVVKEKRTFCVSKYAYANKHHKKQIMLPQKAFCCRCSHLKLQATQDGSFHLQNLFIYVRMQEYETERKRKSICTEPWTSSLAYVLSVMQQSSSTWGGHISSCLLKFEHFAVYQIRTTKKNHMKRLI